MTKSLNISKRLLLQLRHDKRTLALVLFAPLLILTLFYFIFGSLDAGNFTFDRLGAAFLGIVIYFLVFLVAGINLLNERTGGMLERVLVTPVKRGQIVTGYLMGFGLLSIVQSVIICLVYTYVFDTTVEGNIFIVMLTTLLTALNALSLGMLMSTLAKSEFQMVQFIPLIIIPQIVFCGIFPLSENWDKVSDFIPMYYSVDALSQVILKGYGLSDIGFDLIILAASTILFAILNTLILKKIRRL